MQALKFEFKSSDKPGYSLATLRKEDDSDFTEQELLGPLGNAVERFVRRIKSLAYKPVSTLEETTYHDGIISRETEGAESPLVT